MRKDYIISEHTAEDETAFVERYWTEMWDQAADRGQNARKIELTEEYRAIEPFIRQLPPGATLFDGGCGLGDFVVYFHQRGYKSIGYDISRKTIALLREKFPGVSFHDGDIRQTGLPSGDIDAYYSWGVFEHFENGMRDCLLEAYRVLRPGGLLFITVPFDNLRQSLRGAFEAPKPLGPRARFYQWRFTRAELAREVEAAGFQVEQLTPLYKREGLLRLLMHDLRLPGHWLLTRGASRALSPLLPGVVIGHMVLAVARKPAE